MLSFISLENWRSHESTSLQFRKGTNLLVGIMGSGKSSVLDGISFALFGTFPALEHRKLSLAEVIRHGKEVAKVKLGFEWKGAEYLVLRQMRKLKNDKVDSDAEVRKDGKLVEKGQAAVSEYLERLLQVDYDLFSRAIYSEQNNIDRFLNIDPARRKEEMDNLLGLDRFENARANSIKIINRLKSERKALEQRFSSQKLDEMRKKGAEAREKCERLEKEKEALLASASKAKQDSAHADSLFLALRAKKEKSDALMKEIAGTRGALEQLKEELVGKEYDEKVVEAKRKRYMELGNALEDAKKSFSEKQALENTLSKEVGALEARLEGARSAKADLEKAGKDLETLLGGKTIAEISAERRKIEQESVGAAASYQSLLSEIKKLEDWMAKINPELSKCPLCRSSLTKEGVEHVLAEYRHEISEKKARAHELVAQKEKNAKMLVETDALLKKADALVQKVKFLEKGAAQYAEIAAKLQSMQKEISMIALAVQHEKNEVEKAMRIYQQAALECKTLEEIGAKKKKLAHLESALKKNEAEIASLGFSEQEYENARKTAEEKRVALGRLDAELKSTDAQLKSAKELLELADSEISQMEEMESEIEKLLKIEEELSLYKNTLVETQIALRKEVIEAINTAMNGIWGMVYLYGDYKGLRIATDEKGYFFEVYDEAWRPAELVSGGERASIALAFRIALATVLTPNMSLLVLDEPTHNLDKETVGLLAHALQYNLPELVEQSFVITHEEGLMGSEFASTYKMSRDKAANAATVAEEM